MENELIQQGADFVFFVDISFLPENQNKGFHSAILIGKTLSPGFIQKVTEDVDYVQNLIKTKKFGEDEFYNTEQETDRLADSITDFILDR